MDPSLLLISVLLARPALALPPVERSDPQPVLIPGQPRQGLLPLRAEAPAAWADCGDCHAGVQAAWATSRHAAAAVTPAFQVSWAAYPDGWCLHCHAPTVAAQEALLGFTAVPGVAYEDRDLAGTTGVTCATCHLRETAAGRAVATAAMTPSAAAEAAHPVVVEGDLGSASCADCHQFPFQRHSPRLPLALGETPAQDTVAEWTAWRAGGGEEDCAACHLDGHRFPGRELLQLDLQVTRTAEGARVVLAHDAGHAVPTGDPFRALELTLCADAACTEVVGRQVLGRELAVSPTTWEVAADSRLPPSGRGVYTVPLRATAGTPVPVLAAWRLDYRLVDPAHVDRLPAREARLPIARGVLSSPPLPESP